MINIEDAIKKSKELSNISNGGSDCYDFGDYVLIKYTLPLKYVKPGYRARENQEIVMKGINEKVHMGVNTPKHIDMKRMVEGENDVCYVLQEKCKGKNCAPMSKYGVPIEQVLEELKYVNSIPFEHYEKLVSDSCMLYEMGYEAKNKNLFYDEKSGFWFIDFLDNKEDKKFDFNNPKMIFETLKYIAPKPLQIASTLKYDTKLTDDGKDKYNNLRCASKAKFLLACRKVISTFERYEFFYLLGEEDILKKYLMDMGIMNRDLFGCIDDDFETYDELVNNIVNDICEEISINGKKYWDVETNEIRNKSQLFNIEKFYEKYICNNINREDYQDEWEYENDVKHSFTNNIMTLIYNKLCSMKLNKNISNFIFEYESKRDVNHISK